MGKMKNSILKCKFFILLITLKSKFYLFFLIQRIKTVKKASSQKYQTSCLWGEKMILKLGKCIFKKIYSIFLVDSVPKVSIDIHSVCSLLCRYSLTSSFRVKMWSSVRMFSRFFILNICFSFTLSIWTMTGDIFKKPSENDPKTIFGWISDRRYNMLVLGTFCHFFF